MSEESNAALLEPCLVPDESSAALRKPRPPARLLPVYLVGASGVGKSTLAKYISEQFCLPFLSGATRLALADVGVADHAALGCDLEKWDAYQQAVWKRQLELEAPYWSAAEGFVSDRSFDLAVYTGRVSRVAQELTASRDFRSYMERLRASRAVIFFVRIHPELVPVCDGRRDVFLTPSWRYGVEAVIEFILETHRVPYITIGTASFRDRARTVEGVLNLARWRFYAP